jgi:hypothetical protein
MFLWYPVMDLAGAPRRTARKKGSGYKNEKDPGSNWSGDPIKSSRFLIDDDVDKYFIFML